MPTPSAKTDTAAAYQKQSLEHVSIRDVLDTVLLENAHSCLLLLGRAHVVAHQGLQLRKRLCRRECAVHLVQQLGVYYWPGRKSRHSRPRVT